MQSREILKVAPSHPEALMVLGASLRLQGNAAAARAILQPLAAAQPKAAAVQLELGILLGQVGESRAAIAALRRAVRSNPSLASAWRELGDQLALVGETAEADAAYALAAKASAHDPQLIAAATALCENRWAAAERLLRQYLKEHPKDFAAIRMLAEIAIRAGHYGDAEILLEQCLELAPDFSEARRSYAMLLHRQDRPAETLVQTDLLLKREPRNPGLRNLKAAALARIGESRRAIACYEDLLKDYPNQPKAWLSYGHTLKEEGRHKDAIAAYRKSIALMPRFGEAYWSLANMKTFHFTPADLDAMRAQLSDGGISTEDRCHLHFAMGKALEDDGLYEKSFEQYEKGNNLRSAPSRYDADVTRDHVRRSKALFTSAFFCERAGMGHNAPDPIFVVDLPRSGSTLIEQILASHSAVEGTAELPDIGFIVRRLGDGERSSARPAYPEILATLDAARVNALGDEYLERTRIQRRSGQPFFIDKMPNNFAHIGLIHLILPNAKIVDMRRHPLGCCFSCYKQHFARGWNFTYGIAELGRCYRDYVELMAHFDSVLPGCIHRVIYERLVADPESEVRRLLDYCGLTFESACLRFYENDRPVRTASAEQVRQPIFKDSVEHWRNYEPWLGPLRSKLADVLEAYPDVPKF